MATAQVLDLGSSMMMWRWLMRWYGSSVSPWVIILINNQPALERGGDGHLPSWLHIVAQPVAYSAYLVEFCVDGVPMAEPDPCALEPNS